MGMFSLPLNNLLSKNQVLVLRMKASLVVVVLALFIPNSAVGMNECQKDTPIAPYVGSPSQEELEALITLTRGGHLRMLEFLGLYETSVLTPEPAKDLALLLSISKHFELKTDMTGEQWAELAERSRRYDWAPNTISLQDMTSMEGIYQNMTNLVQVMSSTEEVWLSMPREDMPGMIMDMGKDMDMDMKQHGMKKKTKWLEVWYGMDPSDEDSVKKSEDAIMVMAKMIMKKPRVARKATMYGVVGVLRLVD